MKWRSRCWRICWTICRSPWRSPARACRRAELVSLVQRPEVLRRVLRRSPAQLVVEDTVSREETSLGAARVADRGGTMGTAGAGGREPAAAAGRGRQSRRLCCWSTVDTTSAASSRPDAFPPPPPRTPLSVDDYSDQRAGPRSPRARTRRREGVTRRRSCSRVRLRSLGLNGRGRCGGSAAARNLRRRNPHCSRSGHDNRLRRRGRARPARPVTVLPWFQTP